MRSDRWWRRGPWGTGGAGGFVGLLLEIVGDVGTDMALENLSLDFGTAVVVVVAAATGLIVQSVFFRDPGGEAAEGRILGPPVPILGGSSGLTPPDVLSDAEQASFEVQVKSALVAVGTFLDQEGGSGNREALLDELTPIQVRMGAVQLWCPSLPQNMEDYMIWRRFLRKLLGHIQSNTLHSMDIAGQYGAEVIYHEP